MASFSRLQFLLLVILCTNLGYIPSSFAGSFLQLHKRNDTNLRSTPNAPVRPESQARGVMNTSSLWVNDTQDDADLNVEDRANEPWRIAPLVGSPIESYRPDTYIVLLTPNATAGPYVARLRTVLKQDASSPSSNATGDSKIGYIYSDNVLHGFSARLVGKGFDFVSRSPEVEMIVPDTKMSTLPIIDSVQELFAPLDAQAGSGDSSVEATDSGGGYIVQKGTAPWNLQRISQRPKITTNGQDPAKTTYNYSYRELDGKRTIVYVLDTGARTSHVDFEGRVEFAAQFGGCGCLFIPVACNLFHAMWDGNGHGTHCAGVITGRRWGVAKAARVRAVKVLSDEGGGATSDVIAGIQYIIEQYQATGYPPTVASLSLGGGRNTALDRVVQNAINQGIHFAVAAGNNNGDACLSSPSACPDANVVAASDIDDTRAPYSNWGSCVHVFAPGSNVTSAWASSDTATARISGTSMATPHVAGLIAYQLSQHNMSTKAMSAMLKRNANQGVLNLRSEDVVTRDMVAATPNLLMLVLVGLCARFI
ncbi:hypothetical protein CROQUDRAFT_50262 [Cronartium quercuum f. sp. fusiforme G11]|uniref:Uncharacterized protein n=1 Tax=Cronartium quercuum f. sp. fusiforme G11 TaxID=708437 RepID=A0A9P6N9I9_9BASI|nr:hypothetical protein CROQUDRAFT_50262 [Cronartium quercuum f. sp. fusiforme G11]